ncbi:hypothetical protein C1I99_24050, partial [Micromonospora deserti]
MRSGSALVRLGFPVGVAVPAAAPTRSAMQPADAAPTATEPATADRGQDGPTAGARGAGSIPPPRSVPT